MADQAEGTATESSRKKKVMVAIDESESSERALKWALENVPVDSQVVIYSVQPPLDVSYPFAPWGPADMTKDLEDSARKHAVTLLERAKTTCSRYGVVPEVLTEVGDPKVAICDAVERLKIQLLVVGSHGQWGFKRGFLGSVSNYCVHHAECPVVVVRGTD